MKLTRIRNIAFVLFILVSAWANQKDTAAMSNCDGFGYGAGVCHCMDYGAIGWYYWCENESCPDLCSGAYCVGGTVNYCDNSSCQLSCAKDVECCD